jgi:hypothetical protein
LLTINQIVEKGAAVMNHRREVSLPLPETHASIVKYAEPSKSSYITISENIKFLARKAIDECLLETGDEQERQNRLEELRDLNAPCM